MEALAVLPRIPAIAEAMQRTSLQGDPLPPDDAVRPWTLLARERGDPREGVVRLRGYAQGRAMALELSELGFVVTVRDADDQVRLRIWPPH